MKHMYHLFGCSPVCLSRDCKFRFIQHSFEVNGLNYSDEEKSSCFKGIKYEHTSISSSRWTWCLFIENWSFAAAFIHHLKALCLLLIYLRGLYNYLSVLSKSLLWWQLVIIIKDCPGVKWSRFLNSRYGVLLSRFRLIGSPEIKHCRLDQQM